MTVREKRRLWANLLYLPFWWGMTGIVIFLAYKWYEIFPAHSNGGSSDQFFNFSDADAFAILIVIFVAPVTFLFWNIRLLRDFVTYSGNKPFIRINAAILCWPYLALALYFGPGIIRNTVIQQRQENCTIVVNAETVPGSPTSTSVLYLKETDGDTVYLLTGVSPSPSGWHRHAEVIAGMNGDSLSGRHALVDTATLKAWGVVAGRVHPLPDYHFMMDSARTVGSRHKLLTSPDPKQHYIYDTVIEYYLKQKPSRTNCFAFTYDKPDRMNLINRCEDTGKVLASVYGYRVARPATRTPQEKTSDACVDQQKRVFAMVWDSRGVSDPRIGIAFIASFSGHAGTVYQVKGTAETGERSTCNSYFIRGNYCYLLYDFPEYFQNNYPQEQVLLRFRLKDE